ncbi:MAG TPA: iron uptake transporter deferrochelatase/peroxidase subunit [Rhizomicrobium sp.]|jgi:deferrochelatase/peroxidase EfeB|nr:iron uptake transporter deferrochelatase/peroxidase subunit [Rhizomicrobium sp.]
MSVDDVRGASRRGFLQSAGLLAAAAGLAPASPAVAHERDAPAPKQTNNIEPFHGARQGGILTPAQRHSYFAALDLDTPKRDDVITMLRGWTEAAAALTRGDPPPSAADASYTTEPGTDALGIGPSRLTLTFGFGAGLFTRDGKDRYGLGNARPEALIDIPRFPGDQLIEARAGGDLSIQACADDPQVAFHAIRRLTQLAWGTARIRWAQTGFLPHTGAGETPRNLMGFKDGTSNLGANDETGLAKFVFVGSDGPAWMQGGSYVMTRRILIALEHWDRMRVAFQEQTFGRQRMSGAPLGKTDEFDAVDLAATDKDGNAVMPLNSHVRLANAGSNDGARILRRPYSFNDGVTYTAERWPPWRQGMEYDAGLFFVCYQRDPREGFVKIFSKLARLDMLNQFATHTGGGLFACPGGIAPGEFVGEKLFSA